MSYFEEALKKAKIKTEQDEKALKIEVTKDNQKRKYGVEVPTVEDITKQASVIKEHGTDAEVSNYLGGAISDGVISANDGNNIFRQVTGSKNNLYSPENIKTVNKALENAIGIPKKETQPVNPFFEKYKDMSHDDTIKAYNDLYAKYAETGDVSLVEELEYLKGRSEETAGEDVLEWKRDRAKSKANEAWNDYEYFSDGTAVATPNSVYGNKNEGKAKAKYNAYKSFASGADRYGKLYDDAKTRRIIAEFEEPAMKQSDFESKSKYDGEYYGVIHDYVNGKHTYSEVTQTGIWSPEEQATAYAQEAEYLPYTYVTEKERKVFNYLIKTDREKALEYIETLKPELNRRSAEALSKETAKMAEEAPFGASVISVPLGIAGGIKGSGELLKSMVTGEEIDANAPAFAGNIMSEAIRGTVAENINNPVGKFFYNIGMSMADSVAVMPLGGAGTVFLGMNAAVSEGRKTALEGGSKSEILTKGIAAGVFEALFEKFSIDKLLSPKAVGSASKVLKTILQQGGIEASEEFCTSLANNIVEDLTMGGESQFNALTRKYIEEGYSHSEAQTKAALDMAGDVAIETLSGFVSGVLFGGAGATMNYAQATNTGKAVNAQGNKNALIDYAKMQDSNSTAYKDAVKLSKKDNVKNAEVGALLQQMIIDKQISEADAKMLVTEGLNGVPLDKAEQVYYYAGANGLSIQDTVELNSNLTVDPDRAIAAWQMGAKLYEGSKADVQNAEAVEKNTERPKEIEKTKKAPAVQNGGNVAETPAVQNNGRAKSIVKENYNEAAEKFRTEENTELFNVAYNQGLLGEKLNLGVIVPDKDISAISQAYVAGTRDARIISERRANFDNRIPGLFTDAVTEQLSKKIGSRTLNAIDALGKKLGVQIHFIQRGEAGHEKDSYYSPSKGVIAINVNEIHGKLTGDKLIRFIANHEGVHRIRETSPKAFAEMEKIALSKSRQTVKDRMARFGESKERATEEIVADYFGEVLTSKAEIKTLLNEHRNVFDAIMEALEWLVDKMRGIANYSFSEIAEARKLFREALAEADANVWGKEVRVDETGSYGENEVVLSRSTYDEEGRTKLINWLNNSKLEKSEKDRIVSQLDFIYDITTKYTDKFTVFGKWSQAEVLKGEDGKPVLSVVKQNGEYKLNLDFSSVCSKRRPLDTIITKMVESGIINDVLIDENGLVKLNQIINKHGLTVACALCYVEGRRYRQEKVAKDFANLYNGLVDRYNENSTDFSKRILAEQPLSDKGEHKETVDYKIAKHLETHPDERKHIDYTDFMSSEGFTKVAKENPELLKLYNSKKGTGGPKAAFADVQYLNEILSKKAFNAKTAFAVGGVRIQSFSDFVPRLVFDYAQMVADLDAKKLPAHAYTKVVDFVKIFGLTGIKINMSLIPKYVKGGVAPGLDADGNYAWDAESFDFDTAIEIQSDEGYSKNCGTIAVGVSYGHIMKLLADDRIKMVIPYHKSGINPIVAKMLEISAYEDYTESQTTKHNDGTALTKEEKKREFNFNEVMHNRGLTAKEAADEYLKWCDKNDYRPKFAEFRDNKNYYKLLADFSCYDVNGEYSPQTAVKMNYPDNVDALIGEAIGKDQSNEDAILREADGIIEEFSAWNETRDDGGVLWSRSEDSEDNVKYFPPGEDPRREIKVPSEVNGKKVRRFTRTAAESPALTPEMAEDVISEIENGRFYYTPSSNKALADNAMNKVENNVIQAASEWKTAFDSGKMITDKDIALGEALIIEAGKRGDTERAIELISEVGIAATEAGKAVQAIKLLKRMTPEGQVYYLSKVVERLNKERGKTKGKEFDKSIEAENKATEADKKYKQAEAKVKTAEEKLFDIETAIEEYTKDLDIEVKIAESVEKIADLKKKLSEAKGKVKSANASSEKLGGKIKEIEGQLEEERNKLKEAMAKRDAIKKERAEKGIMLSKLKAGVKRVDNATDRILGQIDILEDDISKVEAEYDKAVKFRDECAEERRRLIKEKNSLIRKTESADKASERDLKKISQLEEEISKLSDKYLVAKKTAEDAAEIRKQLTAERNKLRDKLERKENAVVRENEKISKLKEEIAQLLNAEYEASKELEKAKEERTLKQKARDKARKLSSAAKMGANIIELPADIKKAILESKTEEELNESVELAKDYIAENMVATKAEMIRAWRYLSMLGNLRTQFRNIIGNGFMLLNVLSKNVVATPIETVAVYVSHKNLEKELAKMKADGATEAELTAYRDEHYAERTKTWTLFKKKSDVLKNFVTESWESNIKLAKGQSGKNDNIIGDINDRRTMFKSEKPVLKQVAAGVEAWRKATNWAMERGDEVFLKINYKHALTSYILSNKWDVATMTEAQKMRAEQYALKEAQEATFRDESVLADWINKGRNKGWGYELAIGGLMPFTKTPINITKRSIEYGPTGIVNAIVQGVKASKGQATSADVVNALAKTFSGSVLAGLGFVFAAMGLLRSKGDKEDEEYNYLIGEQDYSLVIGDYRFSIEWAAPAAIPLLFGASIYNAWFEKDGGIKEEYMVDENGNLVLNTRAMAMHKVMNATSAMFAPIFEASYLSGLTDSIGAAFSFANDASEALAIMGINAGLSYANQFIPTVLGQIARTIDPAERRNNDYNKTLPLSYSVQKGIAKAKNKIPGLNQTSTPYVNAWGEEEIKQGALDYILSGAENLILPGYIEEVTDDELTDELWRLEKTEAAEGKKVFPESVKTSYTEDRKTIPLTAEQRNERQKVTGQRGREYIEAFYNSDEYGKLTDAERVEAIDLLWAKANEEGIQAVSPDYVSKDSNVIKMNITEKNVGISPVDYALWKIAYEKANADGNDSYNTDEVNAALDIFIELSGEEWTDEQLGYLWETRASALSKSNPYGRALLGTPWYQRKKEEGNTWMRERE